MNRSFTVHEAGVGVNVTSPQLLAQDIEKAIAFLYYLINPYFLNGVEEMPKDALLVGET